MTDCHVLIEASSSKIGFTGFKSNNGKIEHITIGGKDTVDLKGTKILDYVTKMDYTAFAKIITTLEIFGGIMQDNPECTKNNIILLATAGIRNNVLPVTQKEFYQKLATEVNKGPYHLTITETLTADQEGYFAWISIKIRQSLEGGFTSIDMGGVSMQITNQTNSLSFNLGKDVVKKQIGIDNLKYCYGDNNLYNGTFCREKATNFIDNTSLPQLLDQHPIFAISSFENCFNDICGTFLPILTAPSQTILNACTIKQQKLGPFVLKAEDYKNISDEICHLWPEDWNISTKKYQYAADACFTLNYLYELSHKLGLKDLHELNVSEADWTLGAAQYFLGMDQSLTTEDL